MRRQGVEVTGLQGSTKAETGSVRGREEGTEVGGLPNPSMEKIEGCDG